MAAEPSWNLSIPMPDNAFFQERQNQLSVEGCQEESSKGAGDVRAHEGERHSPAPAQEATADHSRHGCGIAPNLLQRAFEADQPNTIWLADITYVATDEGWLYLAAVKDMATREIFGWSII